ncbi:AC5 protein [Bhendi yellow vein mosaic virus [India:Raichur:OY54A:2005]]|uniref:AC5 n=1 Tax=Bhendi yellow vein mosaic virus TaxID=120168 RepID=J9ZWR9_9GEMI|nr:AC5 protein [Bhendi yellow vein mosaic virus [India:Raichur:OY49:2005]]ADO40949.1 AC5 protein [Bhendi yellow vein mosaic virus [India:Raichur:OY54A:2005]]ADO40956.1 AC5 protein [Bhendi yellow vein mosaic virus [India:Raichur:OY54B:2005]]ADO40970.1 AC5 protein [Bhendi yellow vein mosaic virus [India:Raichur:OY59:2005]]ADO40998.1 AC5 protein [Bhendi yellow vein mosaic virus [India:Raichur:OY56:2005]]AFS63535.1 AC5 [Bhendi yellow vein mosaic virus]
MGTSHIKHQRILRMILIFSCLLLVVNNIIVNPNKFLNQRLFLTRILSTSNGCMPFPQHLVPIPMHVLHGRRTGLVIKHIKYFTKILWFICRSSITNKEKHHRIRMVLGLDVLVHPYLT